MKKVIIASVIGAVVLFVWGFVFWALLPIGPMIFSTADEPASTALVEALKDLPESGTYSVPPADLFTSDPEEFIRQHEAGPNATVFLYLEGRPPMSVSTYVFGYLNMLVAVFVAASLLHWAAGALTSYAMRIVFVVAVGLVGVVLSDLGNPLWWNQPWGLYVANAIYHVSGWCLVGLALAKIVAPGSSPSPTT